MKKPFVLSFCIVLAFCLALVSPAAGASDEEEVLQVAETWTKAISTGDYKAWSSLWKNSPDTSNFGPPNSMAFLTRGYEAIVNGMESLFEYPPGTFTRTHHNPQATILSDGVAVLTVYEILTLNPPMVGAQTIYQCRQTLVLQKSGGKWQIVHGHGSYLPVE